MAVDDYLREIAKTITVSLLGETSSIRITVEAEPLEIDPERALPFGLLVNELTTNAIKHAFPNEDGNVIVKVSRIDNQMELTVSDDGVGMANEAAARRPENRGADYVAIFVRQLGGIIAPPSVAGSGTTIRITLPLILPQTVVDHVVA